MTGALPPGARALVADRRSPEDLDRAIGDATWDVVVDTWGSHIDETSPVVEGDSLDEDGEYAAFKRDPTTAVQAIDRLRDALRQLARRPFPDGTYRDEDGEVRLIVPAMDWNGYVHLAYVHLAFEEIRLAGAASPQVTRRLQAALEDLKTVALPERLPILDRQLELLASSTKDVVSNPHDVKMGLSPDRLGFGVRADVASFADDAESTESSRS